jgi:hypothetical protein
MMGEEYTDDEITECNEEDAMLWVNLSPEEIKDLRTKKYEITEYAKAKLKELLEKNKDT